MTGSPRMLCFILFGLVTAIGCYRSAPPPATNSVLSRVVPPGKTGDFSFSCPSEGTFTMVVSGDCEKSVMFWSNDHMAVSEQVNALPGMQQAVERKDHAEMTRIVESGLGKDTAPAKLYAKGLDFDVFIDFRAPPGKLERDFKLIAGKHTMMVTNESNHEVTIEVVLKPAQ